MPWLQVTEILTSLAVIGLVYLLGQKAYFRQKEYENVRARYLDKGVELVCSQVGYVFSVFNSNWTLYLRTLKQYRDIEEFVAVDDFFVQFIELDLGQFQTTPIHKVNVLLNNQVVWRQRLKVLSAKPC